MWHSSVSPTREYDLPVSLSALGKSDSSSGCDWLKSGRLDGIQLSSTGVDALSASACSVKGVAALVLVEAESLF